MNNKEASEKIRADLREAFPLAQYRVEFTGRSLDIEFVGGYRYADEFKTMKEASDALAEVIRRTLPDFEFTYE